MMSKNIADSIRNLFDIEKISSCFVRGVSVHVRKWCGHCKKTKPEFQQAADAYKNDPKVEFGAVDCTTQQPLCSNNNIEGYPTIIYYSYFSKDKKIYNGGRTANDFTDFMENPLKPVPVSQNKVPKEEWQLNSPVNTLNTSNFHKELSTKGVVLVMFYAPWCGHCKKLKPDFQKAAEELQKEGVKCELAALDCTTDPEIADEYGISGFPTIKLFKDGKYIEDYSGKRTVEDLKNFIRSFLKIKKRDEL